jgi:hypothetical protein
VLPHGAGGAGVERLLAARFLARTTHVVELARPAREERWSHEDYLHEALAADVTTDLALTPASPSRSGGEPLDRQQPQCGDLRLAGLTMSTRAHDEPAR